MLMFFAPLLMVLTVGLGVVGFFMMVGGVSYPEDARTSRAGTYGKTIKGRSLRSRPNDLPSRQLQRYKEWEAARREAEL